MAKTPSKSNAQMEELTPANTLPDNEHPAYIAGTLAESNEAGAHAPVPGGPMPGPIPGPVPGPFPGPIPGPVPGPVPIPLPRPVPLPFPRPIPLPQFCGAVSGRYRYSTPVQPVPPRPVPWTPWRPRPSGPFIPGPIIPINMLTVVVRVDVDRFYPQQRISVEVSRLFPRATAHAIAEVQSDICSSLNNRTIVAGITYRDGDASLIPGNTLTFTARRTSGFGYGAYRLQMSGGGITPRSYDLSFESRYFDPVEFEVDRVSNATPVITAYDTGSHPNRPAGLPNETLSLQTVYQRAGFDVAMSPNASVIPTSGAGANGTWSDTEMHNAMVAFWSRFADRPNWAMWVLYAHRHDSGRGLGGVMFDDIGPNHRQGTAIFTDSFIQDVPPGDPDPAAWRNRMQFWTAVHEMGHGFNLAHSWQKALGVPQGAPGDPWIPLANDPDSRSFMNYPFRQPLPGGEQVFFSDFEFRFSDDELLFMRHAPRRFVQMGNSNWFENHGFEAPDALSQTGNWALEIRPNRDSNTYRFLEPVTMELKLTNTSGAAVETEDDLLGDGRHFTVFLQREGGPVRQWKPMITRCHESHQDNLDAGEATYGAHMISATGDGWTVDEPGFYKLQAAVDMGAEVVVSNVLRLYVAPPSSNDEAAVAPDYFTEDVGRVLVFRGAPELAAAQDTLQEVAARCADNPAARHAEVALSAPGLRDFKTLDAAGGRGAMKIAAKSARVDTAARAQSAALIDKAAAAADTMGHIPYFGQLRTLAEALEDAGDRKGAVSVMEHSVKLMKKRNILGSVIDNIEARLKRRK